MSRTDRLTERMEARELDSLLVTDLVNVCYLSGYTGTNGACVVTRPPGYRMDLRGARWTRTCSSRGAAPRSRSWTS